jgi:hypothetical protein
VRVCGHHSPLIALRCAPSEPASIERKAFLEAAMLVVDGLALSCVVLPCQVLIFDGLVRAAAPNGPCCGRRSSATMRLCRYVYSRSVVARSIA